MRRRMTSRHERSSFSTLAAAWLTALTLLSPAAAFCQDPTGFQFQAPRYSVGIRGGYAVNAAHSDLHRFLSTLLTLDRSDFDGPVFAMDVSWHVLPWLDAMMGFEVSGSSATSEYRHLVDQNDLPITQRTRVTQVPITFSAKAYPLGRGKQVGQFAWIRKTVVPYVGAGFGPTWYELKQNGDFVDFNDCSAVDECSIFEGSLRSSGWAFAGHVFLGIDIKITQAIGAIVEARYYWATSGVGSSFVGFQSIDLDGAHFTAGINWKL
jgi:hypothetical protein